MAKTKTLSILQYTSIICVCSNVVLSIQFSQIHVQYHLQGQVTVESMPLIHLYLVKYEMMLMKMEQ